jgi:hypothetical protein
MGFSGKAGAASAPAPSCSPAEDLDTTIRAPDGMRLAARMLVETPEAQHAQNDAIFQASMRPRQICRGIVRPANYSIISALPLHPRAASYRCGRRTTARR